MWQENIVLYGAADNFGLARPRSHEVVENLGLVSCSLTTFTRILLMNDQLIDLRNLANFNRLSQISTSEFILAINNFELNSRTFDFYLKSTLISTVKSTLLSTIA